MAGYDVSVGKDLLPELFVSQGGLAKLVEAVLKILEAQETESRGGDRYERLEERQGYRNSYRLRALFSQSRPMPFIVELGSSLQNDFPFCLRILPAVGTGTQRYYFFTPPQWS